MSTSVSCTVQSCMSLDCSQLLAYINIQLCDNIPHLVFVIPPT